MIAKKHAQTYMPNGEVSLDQVIQAAIDEATEIRKQEVALILTGAHARIRQLEAERVPLADVAKATQLLKNERDDEAYELLVKVLAAAPAQEKV